MQDLTASAGTAAPRRRALRLDEALRAGNSLGLIRLVLSALVIVGHGYELGGRGKDPLFGLTGFPVSSLAVVGFFCISGYLITKSAERTQVVPYLWRRALRIFPAFLVVLLVTAFVVGPLVTYANRGSLDGYLSLRAGGPLTYVWANAGLEIGQTGIDGLFLTTPFGQETGLSVVNGSLWTLIHEWRCYLLVAVLAVIGVIRRARWLVLVLTAVLQALLVLKVLGSPHPDRWLGQLPAWDGASSDWAVIRFTVAFMFGACLALYARRIPCDDRIGWACTAVFFGSLAAGSVVPGGAAVLAVGVPAAAYAVLWGSTRLPVATRAVGAKADYSYGVYIYGFLVQQCLAFLGVHTYGVLVYIVAALLVVAPLAWLSWHLVEAPAMSLKDWGPGRWRFPSPADRSTVRRGADGGDATAPALTGEPTPADTDPHGRTTPAGEPARTAP